MFRSRASACDPEATGPWFTSVPEAGIQPPPMRLSPPIGSSILVLPTILPQIGQYPTCRALPFLSPPTHRTPSTGQVCSYLTPESYTYCPPEWMSLEASTPLWSLIGAGVGFGSALHRAVLPIPAQCQEFWGRSEADVLLQVGTLTAHPTGTHLLGSPSDSPSLAVPQP